MESKNLKVNCLGTKMNDDCLYVERCVRLELSEKYAYHQTLLLRVDKQKKFKINRMYKYGQQDN